MARVKYNIKEGDKVVVIAGDDKGATGKVLNVNRVKGTVLVEEVNLVKKHQKPTNQSQGGIIEQPAPIHISNVMLLDPQSSEPTRVGRRMEDDKLVRFSKKSGENI